MNGIEDKHGWVASSCRVLLPARRHLPVAEARVLVLTGSHSATSKGKRKEGSRFAHLTCLPVPRIIWPGVLPN
jgi:hypothetical protein